MFKNQSFYHQHIKKAIIAFGTLFANIQIDRKNSSGDIVQSLQVPLAYSTKQKFLSRIRQIPDATTRGEVAITLPRMGFEIQQFLYDPSRKVSQIQRNKAIGVGDDVNKARSAYVSTPYNMSLSLYIFCKHQEDGLQIVEQILPHFNPDFNVTINELPELGVKRDLKITLDSIQYDDEYDGEYSARQSLIWTLNFTMRINFFGDVSKSEMIKTVITQLYTEADMTDIRVKQLIRPKNPTTDLADTTLGPADTYEFIDDIIEYFEGDTD